MITKHLSEDEIQQYALDRSVCESKIANHVQLCEECQAKVATYQLLFTGISQQQEPSFDFSLSELVLAQLPEPKLNFWRDSFLIYLLIFVIILLAGFLSWIFRGHVLSHFVDVTPFVIYLIVTTAIILLIALGFDMYKSYHKKMSNLDFY